MTETGVPHTAALRQSADASWPLGGGSAGQGCQQTLDSTRGWEGMLRPTVPSSLLAFWRKSWFQPAASVLDTFSFGQGCVTQRVTQTPLLGLVPLAACWRLGGYGSGDGA